MIGRTNAGGGLMKSVIVVTAPTGSTVTCKSGTATKTAAEKSGTWTFSGLDNGTWTVTATKSGQTATKSVSITRLTVSYVTITYFSATINVTYPAGSTCTAKNGSTTLTAPGTTGIWACKVPNSGTWVVTATNGTQTKSENVTISSDGQSAAVTLVYTLALTASYWNGSISNMTASFSEDHHPRTNVFTKNKIDLTHYNTLSFKITRNSTGGLRASFYISSANTVSSSEYAPNGIVASLKSISATSTKTIDTSALSGSYYLSIFVDTLWNESCDATLSNVTLS